MAQLMLVQAQYGWQFLYHGTPSTNVLFTVRDRRQVALYHLEEFSDRIARAIEQDILKGRTKEAQTFGLSIPGSRGQFFTPRAEVGVDGLANGVDWRLKKANGSAPSARARFRTVSTGSRATMGLTAFLESGPENLDLELASRPDVHGFVPADYEWGEVRLIRTARYQTEAGVDKMAKDAMAEMSKGIRQYQSDR